MGLVQFCLDALEHWPVIKTKTLEGFEAPWAEKLVIGKNAAGGFDEASQPFQRLFAPDTFLRSPIGRAIVEGSPSTVEKVGQQGLMKGDLNSRVLMGKFRGDHENLLRMIDPTWEPKPGQDRIFDKDVSDLFTDYFVKGIIKNEELPPALAPKFGAAKQDFIDIFKSGEPPGELSEWNLNSDIFGPMVKKLFNPETPYPQAGLLKMVPKEISMHLFKEGEKAQISGIDFIKAAYPKLVYKNQFDPTINYMREHLSELPEIEQEYTKTLIDRMTGRPTTIQEMVDSTVNNVRWTFGMPKADVSPAAKFAYGMTGRFYDGIMLYNPGMAALNLTQSINTASKFGMKETLDGFKNYTSKAGQMLNAERQTLGDVDRFWYSQAPANAWEGGMQKFRHAGYYMFDAAENFNRGIAFHTGLNQWMKEAKVGNLDEFLALRGGSEGEKVLYRNGMLAGMQAAHDTQFLYGVVHQSPYLSSPLAKLLGGQFLSFPLRQTEFFIKQLRSGDAMFPLRYMAYTGAASGLAYYGMGIAMGQQLGGAGALPEAFDLLQQGHTHEAGMAALGSLVKTLPGSRGPILGLPMSPFGQLMWNTLNLMSSDSPEAKWGKFGNSFIGLIPAGVQIRRTLTGGMQEFFQEGDKFSPQGPLQNLAIPTALSKAAEMVFGEPIPGVSPRYTGGLQRHEELLPAVLTGLGIRTRQAEMDSRILAINKGTSLDVRAQMEDFGSQAAQALLYGKPEDFNTVVQAAMQSGQFATMESLNRSIESAIRKQRETPLEREARSAPKAEKLRRATSGY